MVKVVIQVNIRRHDRFGDLAREPCRSLRRLML
jgi:hypothetical protein